MPRAFPCGMFHRVTCSSTPADVNIMTHRRKKAAMTNKQDADVFAGGSIVLSATVNARVCCSSPISAGGRDWSGFTSDDMAHRTFITVALLSAFLAQTGQGETNRNTSVHNPYSQGLYSSITACFATIIYREHVLVVSTRMWYNICVPFSIQSSEGSQWKPEACVACAPIWNIWSMPKFQLSSQSVPNCPLSSGTRRFRRAKLWPRSH